MLDTLPPFSIFYLAALLVVIFSNNWLRCLTLLATPILAAILLFSQQADNTPINLVEFNLLSFSLTPYRIDQLSLIFAYLFILAGFLGNVFALHIKDTSQQVATLIYIGSALGAVFAGDLLSLFLFWEMLAISSVFLIWAQRTDAAIAVGFRYLITQVISGVLLLAGVLIYYHQNQTLAFTHIGLNDLSSWLIFIAFGIKCAFPFLHNWLVGAYPEATPTGTVFLSAFSTKVAVYALARGFAGTEILIEIGAVMLLMPILYAIIENDLRRVLAYLMLTQIGIMVIGVGIGTELAINGVAAHVFIHVIYKSLLFMTIGTVLFSTGLSKATELGGLYKTLPKTSALCFFGTVFLLFSALISKSLVMQAAIETGHSTIWLLLLASAAGVFHAALRVPFYAFFAKPTIISSKAPPQNMLIAMYLSALTCLTIAIFPQQLYQLLPYPLHYWPYDLSHVLTHTELVCFATLAFIVLSKQGIYPAITSSINLDSDWFYRKPLKQLVLFIYQLVCTIYRVLAKILQLMTQQPKQLLLRLFAIDGTFERMPASGIAISIILGVFMLTLLKLLVI